MLQRNMILIGSQRSVLFYMDSGKKAEKEILKLKKQTGPLRTEDAWRPGEYSNVQCRITWDIRNNRVLRPLRKLVDTQRTI